MIAKPVSLDDKSSSLIVEPMKTNAKKSWVPPQLYPLTEADNINGARSTSLAEATNGLLMS